MAKTPRKSKTNAQTSTSRASSADKMKDMFDQFGVFPTNLNDMTRSNIEAFSKSAQTFGKGMAEMNAKAMDFMQTNIARNLEVARTIGGIKSTEDLGSVQEMTTAGFKTYVEQMNEMSALFATTLREASEPLSTQAGTVVEKFQMSV